MIAYASHHQNQSCSILQSCQQIFASIQSFQAALRFVMGSIVGFINFCICCLVLPAQDRGKCCTEQLKLNSSKNPTCVQFRMNLKGVDSNFWEVKK